METESNSKRIRVSSRFCGRDDFSSYYDKQRNHLFSQIASIFSILWINSTMRAAILLVITVLMFIDAGGLQSAEHVSRSIDCLADRLSISDTVARNHVHINTIQPNSAVNRITDFCQSCHHMDILNDSRSDPSTSSASAFTKNEAD